MRRRGSQTIFLVRDDREGRLAADVAAVLPTLAAKGRLTHTKGDGRTRRREMSDGQTALLGELSARTGQIVGPRALHPSRGPSSLRGATARVQMGIHTRGAGTVRKPPPVTFRAKSPKYHDCIGAECAICRIASQEGDGMTTQGTTARDIHTEVRRSAPDKLAPTTRGRIVDLLKSGAPNARIVKSIGVSMYAVSKVAREEGIYRGPHGQLMTKAAYDEYQGRKAATFRANRNGKAPPHASLRQALLVLVNRDGPIASSTQLPDLLKGAGYRYGDLHNIQHVLGALHRQGLITYVERAKGNAKVYERIASALRTPEPAPEPKPEPEPEPTPEPVAATPEYAQLVGFPVLAGLRARMAGRDDASKRAETLMAAAEVLDETGTATDLADSLIGRAEAMTAAYSLSPVEAEYLAYAEANPNREE